VPIAVNWTWPFGELFASAVAGVMVTDFNPVLDPQERHAAQRRQSGMSEGRNRNLLMGPRWKRALALKNAKTLPLEAFYTSGLPDPSGKDLKFQRVTGVFACCRPRLRSGRLDR